MIYFDNASTERMNPRVAEGILPYLTNKYGNPSSSHTIGREARADINKARQTIAELLNLQNYRTIFNSGGSEANNQALMTAYRMGIEQGKNRIIISEIEHDSVYKTAKSLEHRGFEIVTIPVDRDGFVSPMDV